MMARSANRLDLCSPGSLRPLWSKRVFAFAQQASLSYSGDWNVVLAYRTLALAALDVWMHERLAWCWLALAGGALLFALTSPLRSSGRAWPTRQRSLLAHSTALILYLLLGLALTWPLAAIWDRGFLGFARSFQDGIQNVWNMWWMRYAVDHGLSPFWNPLLYYPDGLSMYLQAISAPAALFALPVTYLAGPTAAYNAATVGAAALTGYTVFLLVRAYVPGWRIPVLCGALIAASPFMMTRLLTNQLNLTSMQWLPLYMLALLRLEQRRSWPSLAAATAVVLVLILTDWYWTLAAVLYTLVWMLTGLASREERGALVRRYAQFAAAVLLVTTPLFVLIFQARAQLPIGDGGRDPIWEAYVRGFSLDLAGLFYPAAYQPLWPDWAAQFLDAVRPSGFSFEGSYTAAGWVLLALAALGLRWYGRAHWRLVVCAAVGFLFALGPSVQLFGRDTGIPMPYALLQDLPLISTARRPNLFAGPCLIIAAIFAGLALQRMRERWPWRRVPLLAVVVLLAVVELWPPLTRDMYLVTQSPVVAAIRNRPGVVADLPYERQESSRSLLNQIAHEQPMLGGYVSRRPRYDALRFMPHLAQLSELRRWPQADIIDLPSTLLAAQCAYPVRHVLVARSEVPPEQLAELEGVLATIAGHAVGVAESDAAYQRYELPSTQATCHPFLYLGRGWHQVERDQDRVWRWASAQSDLWLVNPHAEPLGMTVEMELEAYGDAGVQRMVQLEAGGTVIAEFPVERQRRTYRLFIVAPTGTTQLQLQADARVDDTTGRALSFSATRIRLVSVAPLP